MKTKAEAIIDLIDAHAAQTAALNREDGYSLNYRRAICADEIERYNQAVKDLEAAFNNKEEQA